MMRKLALARAAWNHPSVKLALAGMAITWAVQALIDTVGQLREDVAQLGEDVVKVRQAVATTNFDAFHQKYDPLGPPNPAEADEDAMGLLDDMADR